MSCSLRTMSPLVLVMMIATVIGSCDSTSIALPPTFSPRVLYSSPAPIPSSSTAVSTAAPFPMVDQPVEAPASDSYAPQPASMPRYQPNPDFKPVKAAYWASFDEFPASSIDTSYFTHIYYAFLLPEADTFKLNVTTTDLQKMPEFINVLRDKTPPVKTLLSIGGANNNLTVFGQMASTKETRAMFINSTIEVARQYGFDGLDLDWEYPRNDQEMFNLALLYKEWRRALAHEARTCSKPRLLLTSAVYYSSKRTDPEPTSYPAHAINKFVDWINPMCYDYHGSWANFTGPNSALYDLNSTISTDYGIGSWLQAGVLPEKLVMGLPLYGRTWKLKDPIHDNGIGAIAVGAGPGDGMLDYNEIVDFNRQNNAVVHYNGEMVFYYSVAGDIWIAYDDTMSIDLKMQFARARGLSGHFFWALGQDKNWTISRLAASSW